MQEYDPRHALNILGHDDAINHFYEVYEGGKLPHAWLITGQEGVGKASLAFYFARILLKGENPESPVGRRISADTHGDLLYISRQRSKETGQLRKEISVEDIRRVNHFFHHTSTEGGWRVVIIDGVEYFNRHSANALLKILEEPPEKSVLLLTSASVGRLLPTLLSRCRRLALSPLNNDEMRILLPDLPQDILKRSGGIPGRAIFLLKDKDGKIAKLVENALHRVKLDHNIWEIIKQIARLEDGFLLFCELLREGLSRAVYDAIDRNSLDEAAFIAQKVTELLQLRHQTEALSLDKAQAMRQAFENIAQRI